MDTYGTGVREVLKSAPKVEAEEIDTALRESLRAQRSALLGLQHDGVISEEIFNNLSLEINTALEADKADLYQHVFGVPRLSNPEPPDKMGN